MALAMGSIMAVVAVLLSHIDRKEEVIIMPKISLERKKDKSHQTITQLLQQLLVQRNKASHNEISA